MTLTESLAGDRKVCMCVHVFMSALCAHVYVHMCALICVSSYGSRGQYQMSSSITLPYFLRSSFQLNLEITKARLAGQQTQGLQLSLPFKHWSQRCVLPVQPNSTLLTESQPQECFQPLLLFHTPVQPVLRTSPSDRWPVTGSSPFYTQRLPDTAFVSRHLPC